MGFIDMLLGTPEGVRESMRRSYDKHYNLAASGQLGSPDDDLHQIGLYGALASRLQARGAPVQEPAVWAELAPFLQLEQETALEALAEYALYTERPNEARTEWLISVIKQGYQHGAGTEQFDALSFLARANGVAWVALADLD